MKTFIATSTRTLIRISIITSARASTVRLGTMPCFIKLYIPTIAYNAIPALISNAILISPSATWRRLKVAYRAYKALFRPGEEV